MKVWPYAQKIGGLQYTIFGSAGIAMAVYVWFFMPETRGHSMEDMDGVFAKGWLFPGSQNKVVARSRTLERAMSLKSAGEVEVSDSEKAPASTPAAV